MSDIYPWHVPSLKQWHDTIELNRLTPVTIIRSREGFADEKLVAQMTQRLLCDAPENGLPCQKCRHCFWAAEGTHVNVRISRETDKKRKIKDIRELEAAIWQTGSFGKPKVVNLFDIDELTVNAQSALLKTLEEPPEDTFFILTAKHIGEVLPTVISRARRLAHPNDKTGQLWTNWVKTQTGLSEEAITDYLAQAKMSPLKLVEYVNEQDKLGALDQAKHQFKAFLTGQLSSSAYATFLDEHDTITSLDHALNMLDNLIKTLFSLNEKPIKTVWHTETSIKQLFQLRDIIDKLIALSRTNCDLTLQTQSELTTWNHERRR